MLAALACVGATLLVWPRPAPVVAPPAVVAPAGPTLPNAAKLARLHLFGTPLDAGTPSAPPPPPPALTLTGVLHADQLERARALIAGPDGTQRSYAVGAALPGGARLTGIRPGAVTVSHATGARELALPELALRGAAPARALPVSARILAARQALARRAAATANASAAD